MVYNGPPTSQVNRTQKSCWFNILHPTIGIIKRLRKKGFISTFIYLTCLQELPFMIIVKTTIKILFLAILHQDLTTPLKL